MCFSTELTICFLRFISSSSSNDAQEAAKFYDGKAEDVPLVMWMNGGPGASSLAYGSFSELGPYYFDDKVRKNPKRVVWVLAFSILRWWWLLIFTCLPLSLLIADCSLGCDGQWNGGCGSAC